MFKMDYVAILRLILIYFISLALCQDRIILSNPDLNESNTNTSLEIGTDIPETLLIQLKDVQSVTDLLQRFIIDDIDNGSRHGEPKSDDAHFMGTAFTASGRNRPLSYPSERNGTVIRTSERNGTVSRTYVRKGTIFRKKDGGIRTTKRLRHRVRPGSKTTTFKPRVAVSTYAKPADCKTEEHIIELDKPENGATLYWPSCIRVKRCGGCCTSKLLECKPLATSILNITVLQLHYNHENPGSFENQGAKVFSVEQHTHCACTCKVGPEHCNPEVHAYRANECRCACKNYEQSSSCSGPTKIWDSRSCMCKCRNFRMCSSTRYFDIVTCRCELLRRSLPAVNLNTQNSNISLTLEVSTPSP